MSSIVFVSCAKCKVVLLHVPGASCVDIDGVSVMEGDSVTLHTDVKTKQQERIRWYFNDIRIALISGDLSKICTDVQCNKGTERFRDRLQLDHQTGSLTIMNINTTHSGVYKLLISSSNIDSEKSFSVTVHDVPAAEQDKMKRKSVKEGESVTLDPAVVKNPNDLKVWYFTDILIAEITGDQSKICTDDQCDERFRDRLKLNKTGSLTITNIRTTDSGLYKLQINSSRFSIIKTYSVSVTAVPDSTAAAVAAAVVVAVLLVAAAGVIYCHSRRSIQARKNGKYCIQLI
uniref:Immunoglobulin domain-containing protein n=1 Tax=Sinocyclocheilus anshuiensis TaxID=1608454 RepID=A0A671SCQ5_9TELE